MREQLLQFGIMVSALLLRLRLSHCLHRTRNRWRDIWRGFRLVYGWCPPRACRLVWLKGNAREIR
jgi:hypothetical protein